MRGLWILSALALIGCYPTAGELPITPAGGDEGPLPGPVCTLMDLDDSELPTAVEGSAYDGRVLVSGYDGDGVFSLALDSPPPGLALSEDGRVAGTPIELGTWDLWIRVQQMTIDDAFGCVQIEVRELPKDAFLGYVHDQRTFLTNEEGVQQDLWVRIAQGGEEGMDTVLLRPGLYRPGEDGLAQQGGGDDELIRLLDPDDVTIETDLWVNGDAEPVLDPASHAGSGLFVAGVDTGTLPFTLSHPDFESIESKLQVVPPDWCPGGISAGPGDGACQ